MTTRIGTDGQTRCDWVGSDPVMIAYHDHEWGHVTSDETRLFEKLCLEGFQAGLSWRTVLNKRDRFRAAYDGFDPARIAAYTDRDVTVRAADAGMIRQHAKHAAVVTNARAYLALRDSGTTLCTLIFADYDPARPRPQTAADIPAATPASTRLAKQLKRHGFVFVGPVTMYALMQSVGVVNDHVKACTTSV